MRREPDFNNCKECAHRDQMVEAILEQLVYSECETCNIWLSFDIGSEYTPCQESTISEEAYDDLLDNTVPDDVWIPVVDFQSILTMDELVAFVLHRVGYSLRHIAVYMDYSHEGVAKMVRRTKVKLSSYGENG